jgi:hypothetical protein
LWRRTGDSASDRDVAASALSAAEALAAQTRARTHAAFLTEERILLNGGDVAAAATGYEAIGALGHARRVRAATT